MKSHRSREYQALHPTGLMYVGTYGPFDLDGRDSLSLPKGLRSTRKRRQVAYGFSDSMYAATEIYEGVPTIIMRDIRQKGYVPMLFYDHRRFLVTNHMREVFPREVVLIGLNDRLQMFDSDAWQSIESRLSEEVRPRRYINAA